MTLFEIPEDEFLDINDYKDYLFAQAILNYQDSRILSMHK